MSEDENTRSFTDLPLWQQQAIVDRLRDAVLALVRGDTTPFVRILGEPDPAPLQVEDAGDIANQADDWLKGGAA